MRLIVTLKDRTEVETSADVPTGAPGGPPFGPDDVRAKFRRLAELVLGGERAGELENVVMNLELHSAAELAALAVPPGNRPWRP